MPTPGEMAAAQGNGDIAVSWGAAGLNVTDYRAKSVWAFITGHAAGTNRYAWSQVNDADSTFPDNLASGFKLSGTSEISGWPAYEIAGNTSVPANGTVKVRLYPSPSGSFWVFKYEVYAPGPTNDLSGSGSSGDGPPWTYPDGDGQDPEVLVSISDCIGGAETLTYAKIRPVFDPSTGFLRNNLYDYRTTERCGCTPCQSGGSGGSGGAGDHAGGTSADCGRRLNSVLYASLSGGNGTIALTWDGSTYWTGNKALSCGKTLYLRYRADIVGGSLDYSCTGLTWATDATQIAINCGPPFTNSWAGIEMNSTGNGAGCTSAPFCGTIFLTVSE